MQDVNAIFKDNPLTLQLSEARAQSCVLKMHVTGKNFRNAILIMPEFETEQKKNIRQLYARSLKDIFFKIGKPIDKVFSAKGGSTLIHLPPKQLGDFNIYLQNVRQGTSLDKWVQTTALDAYKIDPNGLIFIEIDSKGNPYPTYKSSDDIFYYDLDGRKCNLVIFNVKNEDALKYAYQTASYQDLIERIGAKTVGKLYRIVDEFSDKIVEFDGKEVKELDGMTLPNYFMDCPAMVVSDIYEFNSDLFTSPFSIIVELANSLLCDLSTFESWKKLHMFPSHWSVRSICPTCEGNGTVAGSTCENCNGTGKSSKKSVRDEIIVDFSEDTAKMPTQFEGYNSPSIEPWELMTGDQDRSYHLMYFAIWGVMPNNDAIIVVDPKDKTATQVLDEKEPMIASLRSFTKWQETIKTFFIDMSATLLYKSAYKGCNVKGGERYVLETPDAIWQKYSDARTLGASQSVLDGLLTAYYEAAYEGSPNNLLIAMRQMLVEPWVHLTISQVVALDCMQLDKDCKIYYSEWCSTLTPMDWLINNDVVMREKLIEYVTPKSLVIKNEAPVVLPMGQLN